MVDREETENVQLPIRAEALLRFWFGSEVVPPAQSAQIIAERQAVLWWQKDEDLDRQARENFEPDLEAAQRGEFSSWEEDARSLLALVLLHDQIPRNIYRGSPQAFSFDARARELSRLALARGYVDELLPIERVFVYLPLEHSEELADQRDCVRLFEELRDSVDAEQRELFDDYLDFARRHEAIIRRFRRFPHRNEVLGRQSTPEEVAFLEQPNSSF